MSEFGPRTDIAMHLPQSSRVGWTLPPGYFVGEYPLLNVVGESMFNTAYGSKSSHTAEPVAIKVSKTSYGYNDYTEGNCHAMVTGAPHVVRLLEYGSGDAQSGKHKYLITEYRSGGTLKDYLHFGALPLDQVVGFANQIAMGINSVHMRHVIHRDIKPGNAYFTDPSHSDLEVADFGSAAVYDLNQQADFDETITTPLAPLTPARDIFNLALTTAEMLRGRALIDVVGPPLTRILTSREKYNDYADARVKTLRYRGRGAFVQPIRRALNWNPNERYADALAFAEDINGRYQELLAGGRDRGRAYFNIRRTMKQYTGR